MSETTKVADGVWRVAGDFRKAMNVFLIEDDGGVTMYDAGTKGMVKPIRRAADELGGLKRIVLGHAHHDHRGSAPGLGVPVLCHPDEVADAEGDGGYHTFDIKQIPWWFSRAVYPILLKRIWDGGPVKISDTQQRFAELGIGVAEGRFAWPEIRSSAPARESPREGGET